MRPEDFVESIDNQSLQSGLTCASEHWFKMDDEREDKLLDGRAGVLFRPDLDIKTPCGALVIEISVRFEQADSLKNTLSEENKYKRFVEVVKRSMGVPRAEVLPVIFRSLGGFPKETRRNLKT